MAADILTRPLREIQPALDGMTDVQELAALGRDERAGLHRAGVLNAIQGRIGQVVTEAPPPRAQNGDGSTMSVLDVPGNRDVGENAIVSGTVTQRRAPNVAVYFRAEGGQFLPRFVPAGSVAQCLQDGATDYCPDCGRPDCGVGADGRLTGDLNGCPARAKIAFATCPICGKKEYDQQVVKRADELAPGEVDLSGYQSANMAQRLKARLDIHSLAFHQDQARINGLAPMPEAGQVIATRTLQAGEA